jgi:nucleoside phosphorylase
VREHVLADGSVLPELFQEFFFGDDALAVCDQVDEDLKSLGSEMNFLAVAAQATPHRVKFNVIKSIRQWCRDARHDRNLVPT